GARADLQGGRPSSRRSPIPPRRLVTEPRDRAPLRRAAPRARAGDRQLAGPLSRGARLARCRGALERGGGRPPRRVGLVGEVAVAPRPHGPARATHAGPRLIPGLSRENPHIRRESGPVPSVSQGVWRNVTRSAVFSPGARRRSRRGFSSWVEGSPASRPPS